MKSFNKEIKIKSFSAGFSNSRDWKEVAFGFVFHFNFNRNTLSDDMKNDGMFFSFNLFLFWFKIHLSWLGFQKLYLIKN